MKETTFLPKTITVKRGDMLQKAGTLRSKIYVVKSGLLRSYAIDAKGREHIFMFAPEGWVMADACSADEPSDLFIDALEDTELQVKEKDPTKEKGIVSIIKRLGVLQKRVIMLMSASAIERYEHFVKTYPDILQRVPQRMIASYLGVTPEALSKLKGQKLEKR